MKLSWEKTWLECLRMWKWIRRIKVFGLVDLRKKDVDDLKAIWLSANNYDSDGVLNDCFFCHYAGTHNGHVDAGHCKKCPAQKIDPHFNCCEYPTYYDNVEQFYNLLVELNKQRLAKKGK